MGVPVLSAVAMRRMNTVNWAMRESGHMPAESTNNEQQRAHGGIHSFVLLMFAMRKMCIDLNLLGSILFYSMCRLHMCSKAWREKGGRENRALCRMQNLSNLYEFTEYGTVYSGSEDQMLATLADRQKRVVNAYWKVSSKRFVECKQKSDEGKLLGNYVSGKDAVRFICLEI